MVDKHELAALLKNGKTVTEAARTLGVSRQRAHQISNELGIKPAKRVEQAKILYRHYNANGQLLYVGISICATNRYTKGHRFSSPWFDSIARIEIERFDTYEDAIAAEKIAIHTELPLFNRTVGVPRFPRRDNEDNSLKEYLLVTQEKHESFDARIGRFGKQLGMSLSGMKKWLYGRRHIPDKMKLKIEQITNGKVKAVDLVWGQKDGRLRKGV